MRAIFLLALLLSYLPSLCAQTSSPQIPREFRAAWVATVYNIDWPSSKTLTPDQQKKELITLLDCLKKLHFNAIIFQVRPECDAIYPSKIEPWSHWLTNQQGRSPGYDPLAFCITEAHARSIEVHAWFNPFRACTNLNTPPSPTHICSTHPSQTLKFGNQAWCLPSHPQSKSRAIEVIMDVVKRYDIDGVHLDDYFYPYPKPGLTFSDHLTPEQRRSHINQFVQSLYSSVKSAKPWLRVGISPFGIWRPGVPATIEAGVDAFNDLACDAPLWLAQGWVDYLAPQLYWSIQPPKQSFTTLLPWWQSRGSRPVWPGIATSRIQSKEDPNRSAQEIINQIAYSRSCLAKSPGHLHWSAKSILTNQGHIQKALQSCYTADAIPPSMPWCSKKLPNPPTARISKSSISWSCDPSCSKVAIHALIEQKWKLVAILPASLAQAPLPPATSYSITSIDRFANTSQPVVIPQP